MPVHPDRVKAVFIAVLDLAAPADRAAFLDRECGGDTDFRRRVDALLAADAGGSVLERPAAAAGPADAAGLVLADRYTLVAPLGEGGMGSVWRAEQSAPVRRAVAVKLIRAGLDGRQVMARFEAERQALAVMDHPHIARVFDAGSAPDGRPFFVMELVEGTAITAYCDARRLTPRQRLELFVPVCQAVQHAHQKGVIHRDLKPTNVLVAEVDGRPVPKVIDFGVAKAVEQKLTDATLDTSVGAVVGTPEYMSPEQASLDSADVDTRTDVYSLGVLLYELLTGATPVDRKALKQAALLEVLRLVREQETLRPSAKLSTSDALPSLAAVRGTEPRVLTGLLRTELDWVVMKALEKDRDRRYESAAGFAADVQRYLAGEPVTAVPPSRVYRLRTFVRRNRPQVLAVGLVVAALATGLVGTGLGLVEARRQRDAADVARKAAEAAEGLATARLAEVQAEKEQTEAQRRRADDERLTAQYVTNFFLQHVLSRANPSNQAYSPDLKAVAAGTPSPGLTVRELLDRVTADLSPEALDRRFGDRPLVKADVLATIAEVYTGLGSYLRALDLGRRAFELRRSALGPTHRTTAESELRLAERLVFAGRREEARSVFRTAWAAHVTAFGADHADTLHAGQRLAQALLGDPGQRAEGIRMLETIRDRTTARFGPDDQKSLYAAADLAFAYQYTGRKDDGVRLAEQVRDRWAASRGADDPQTIVAQAGLALAYSVAGRTADAIKARRTVRDFYVRTAGPDNPNTLTAGLLLASALVEEGRAADAAREVEPVLTRLIATLGPDDVSTRNARGVLAQAYRTTGRAAEAVTLLEKNLAGETATAGASHPTTINTAYQLAAAYLATGRPAEAARLMERVVAARRASDGAGHPNTLITQLNLGRAYSRAGDTGRELAVYREAAGAVEQTGYQSAPAAEVIGRLCDTLEMAGAWPEAEGWRRRWADALQRRSAPPDGLASALTALGRNLVAQSRPGDAEPLLREALAARDRATGTPWLVGELQSLVGQCLSDRRRFAEAEPLLLAGFSRLADTAVVIPPASRNQLGPAADRLVRLYAAWGKPAEAAKWRAERAKLPPEAAPSPRPASP